MFICLRDFGFISIVYGQSLNVFWRGAKCGRGDTSILDEGGGDLAKTPCGWVHAFPPPSLSRESQRVFQPFSPFRSTRWKESSPLSLSMA